MTKKKILIALVAVLAIGGFAAKTFLLKAPVAKSKIVGTIYVLPKSFTVNLNDGHYATLTTALELAPGQGTGGSAEAAAPSTDGFGTLPEEPLIRDIITNIITDQNGSTLTSESGREHLKRAILGAIRTRTDVKVSGVLFTDVAVQ